MSNDISNINIEFKHVEDDLITTDDNFTFNGYKHIINIMFYAKYGDNQFITYNDTLLKDLYITSSSTDIDILGSFSSYDNKFRFAMIEIEPNNTNRDKHITLYTGFDGTTITGSVDITITPLTVDIIFDNVQSMQVEPVISK